MNFLSPEFYDFIAPDVDRYQFLTHWLELRNIAFSTVTIEESRHIFIQFPSTAYDPLFKIKTLLVHYDRVEGSPGANDNSAAVFQVLALVERLYSSPQVHNMRIFLSDGEELGSIDGIPQQGSFALANRFKNLGITKDDVYAIDGCGRGEVLVVSTTGKSTKTSASFNREFSKLFDRTTALAKSVSSESWVTLPVPYSDNAGFIACEIPAIAITVLPKEEASELMRHLHRDKKLERAILDHQCIAAARLPLTWRYMNTQFDQVSTLTESAFVLMHKFLDALAKSRTMA